MKTKSLLLLIVLAFGQPWAVKAQKSLPYEYGFENNDLAAEGWTKYSSSYSTGIAASGHSGECGFMFYKSPDPQYLISPELSTTTNGLAVAFYYKSSTSSYPKPFRVGYSTTGNGVSDFTFGDEITTNNAQWTFFSQTFDANTKYIAIKYEYNASYTSLYLDDFIFEEYSEYPKPKNLVLTTYTSSTATFDWGARTGQDHWDLYYTTSSTLPDAGTMPSVANTATKPYTITGLESGVTYHAYVRGNYNNGEHYSDWSDACDFEVGCYTPTVVESQATCNQAYFAWTPVGAETSWQVAFSDQQGFDPDDVTPETVTTQYFVREDLETGVTYYAHVRAVCGEGDYSEWSAEVSMTTECFAPSNLRATNISPTTATLKWQQGSNESQWQISYSTTENFTPESGTIITVNANPITLEGLTVNTPYYAYVRAVCTETIFSDWSAICTFTPNYELTVSDDESNYNMYVPFYGSYVSYVTKSQFIIPASALTDLLYANINKLTFYAGVETANFGSATFDVLIGELDGVSVFENSEFFDWSAMTSVYSGSLSVSDNKMVINLGDTPYQYMGGDLLIGFDLTSSGNGVTAYWYGAATTGYSAYGGMEMSAYSYSSYSRYKFIPKTTFCYTPGTAPTCLKPTGLSISQGSGTATLAWTAGDCEIHWNVQYKTAASADWSASIPVENTPTCTLNSLLPMTTYQVRIQADCGSGDVSGWISGNFTTPCGSTDVPYSHDFDSDATGNNLPQCWTKINDGESGFNDYPTITGSNAHSASNCLYFYRLASYCGENQLAVLPEMNANLNTLQISFYAKLASGTSKPLAVGVMTDPEDKTTFVKIGDVTVASTEYAQYTVGFETYAGSGRYIAIKCEPDGYDVTGYYVDDIAVTTNNICFAPTAPQISDITAHAATFTWTPGSDVTNWQVQYKTSTDADWSEPVAVSETPSYSFSNLVANATYQARVRTNCDDDNHSDWVEAESFTTDCGFVTIPYNHDFDDDATGHVAPTCWHFSDGTYPYVYESNSGAHSGNHYLQIKKNSDYAATLVLPAIDTDEHLINTLKLTFWAKAGSSSYYYDYLYAGVMTDPDDMSTFQSVQGASTSISTSTYKQFEFYFDNWTGEGNYIALRYGGNITYCIDDIEISVAPTCRQPLDLSTQYTSAHEAEIRWKSRDLRQCNYQVSYSTDEMFNPENGTIVDVAFENTLVNAGTDYRYYMLPGLNANTTYFYYVRANCGNGDYSDWSDGYASLTTSEACGKPDFAMIAVKNTYVKFEWYGDIDTEWEFQYKASSSEEWITPADFVATPGYELYLAYTLHGLTPGADYDVRLRRHCGMYSCPEVDDGYSEWEEVSITTYDGCWDGSPWMCTSHLGTQATLRWLNSAPDMRWQIRYRLSDEYDYPEENIVTTDTLPEASLQQFTLTGLDPNSTYYWEVRGYCGEEEQSDWSDEDYFFTRSTDGCITVDKGHPYYEDFEDGMPDDWSRMNLYNYDMEHYDAWECINANSLAGESFPASMCISSCRECMSWASDGSMILMPAIHIDENATSAWLSFWSKDAFNASDARGTKMIWVNDNYLSTEYTAFDLGGIYQKSSKAGYWRKCFVNLDDFIGQTIIIAFDYVVTHNYNNYDWWVDDVCVQVFDKVGGENVTSGDWNNGDFWGGSTPGPDDDVIINANVNIPDSIVAQANNIVINTDTINTGSKAFKFGKLTVADGGQLKVNNPVAAIVQKSIKGYTRGGNGWYLIAPPVTETLKPNSDSVSEVLINNYDLFAFDGSSEGAEWRNYKANVEGFEFQNGLGYLFANSEDVTVAFTGTVLPSNQTKQVALADGTTVFGGWTLVGNPFTCDAYFQDGRDFYRMNDEGTTLVPSSGVIHPMEGVFVEATGPGQAVVFTTTEPPTGGGKGKLNLCLTKNRSAEVDRVGIRFDKGQDLGRLDLMANPDKFYIPMNGKACAVVHTDGVGEMPIHFEASENGTFSINVNTQETDLRYLHLIDNLAGADVDLLQQPVYSFNGKIGDYANRFKLMFVVNDNDNENDDNDAFAFISDGNIIVAGEGTLQIIDATGRVIVDCNNTTRTVSTNGMAPGVYVLRQISENKVRTQKIVVK